MAGWNVDTAAGPLRSGNVTLLEGSSFCISSATGDIEPGQLHGVFVEDTRILSGWKVRINGQESSALTVDTKEPYRANFVSLVPNADGRGDSALVIERIREVGWGCQEEIVVWNHSPADIECVVSIDVAADFADLFEVKEARVQRRWDQTCEVGEETLTFSAAWRGLHRGVVISAKGALIADRSITYRIKLPPHSHRNSSITILPNWEHGHELPLVRTSDRLSPQARRHQEWVSKIPVLQMSNRSIERTLSRSYEDLGALRIVDPNHPERVVVAAGAPWFMALFGRDSLWASLMALPVDPSLAFGTIQTLADYQGSTVDATSEEEPGKILHEVRLGVSGGLALGGKQVYYGSVDATPLFVALLGEVSRWGFAAEAVSELVPHADRALDWIQHYGDRDGDGFVEYERLNDNGLINQGWKDSWDGINFADGRLAELPIALCEVQAYVYSAYLGRSWMAYNAGDLALAADLRDRAARLKRQFNKEFWIPDRGYYAIALDGQKRQVDSCASNMGHCLLFGIVDDDKVATVVRRLMSPEMFSGWGVRTLATDMAAFNPVSYHNGSVWPHDNAIIATGMLRYGFVEEAQRISTALLEAAEHTDGRLPELFCGFSREQYDKPVPYPAACSPQAWAATTPIQLIKNLMGYYADVSRGEVWLNPVLPESYGSLHITNAPMAGGKITIDIEGTRASVEGLPQGMAVHLGVRPWVADLVKNARLPQ